MVLRSILALLLLASVGRAELLMRKHGDGNPPVQIGASYRLTSGLPAESNSITFDAVGSDRVESLRVEFSLQLQPGGEGVGVLLVPASVFDSQTSWIADWEEPGMARAIGIGFDSSNPPTNDPFDRNGNIYDRPQAEVSLHVAGVERMNRRAVDFAVGKPVVVMIDLAFVPGGALASVRVGGTLVYDRTFLAEAKPDSYRLLIGARGSAGQAIDLSGVRYSAGRDRATPFERPERVVLFDRSPLRAAAEREATAMVDFGDRSQTTGRVVATFRLDAPENEKIDPFDRRGAVYLFDDKQRFELFRFMTPFGRGGEWKIDVTDLLPLLQGERKMSVFIDTWKGGYDVSCSLDFYPGPISPRPIAVRNLWQGEAILGDINRPIDRFFDEKLVLVDAGAKRAKIRMTVTGHGQAPNSLNAAEFLPLTRTVRVNGREFRSELWKTDVYLNPIRPQAGTWKFDRAGWAPGSIVETWELDVTEQLDAKRGLTISYQLAPYVNEAAGQADPPFHWVEGQVIFYAD
jgi:hypothetical protein